MQRQKTSLHFLSHGLRFLPTKSNIVDPDSFNPDPGTDPDPAFHVSPDPDDFFLSKIAIYIFLGLHKGRKSYRGSLQPSKEHPALQKMKLMNFLYFSGPFLPSCGGMHSQASYWFSIGFKQMVCTVATCYCFLALLWFYKTRSFLSLEHFNRAPHCPKLFPFIITIIFSQYSGTY